MKVEVWSDVVCPWCYIGKRNFEAALSSFAHASRVQVRWRSFELDPAAPPVRPGDYADRLAYKYRVPRSEAEAMIARMTAAARAAGLEFHLDRAQPGNTFNAHRLLHLAQRDGFGAALKERLMRANFTDGEAVGDEATLLRLAIDAGLDAVAAEEVLAGDAYGAEVRADEAQAVRLGVSAVPYLLLGGAFAVPGAQAPETFLQALERAWSKLAP